MFKLLEVQPVQVFSLCDFDGSSVCDILTIFFEHFVPLEKTSLSLAHSVLLLPEFWNEPLVQGAQTSLDGESYFITKDMSNRRAHVPRCSDGRKLGSMFVHTTYTFSIYTYAYTIHTDILKYMSMYVSI